MDASISIQKDIRVLLEKMGFYLLSPPRVEAQDSRIFINIFLSDAKAMLQDGGVGLFALQKIFQILISHRYDKDIVVTLDLNGWRKKQETHIRKKALFARRRCVKNRERVALPPMSSYDRRIVHATLASFSDVETQSRGKGSSRCVVVSPQEI